jgi:hypothetical protein
MVPAWRDAVERFKERIISRTKWNDETGCWEWTAIKNKAGYGTIMCENDAIPSGGAPLLAHRASYMAFKGPIPSGHVIRHMCHNPFCVNPDHLESGTQAENIQDMVKAGRWRGGNVRGSGNGNVKTTAAHVAEIRAAYVGRQNRMSAKTGPTLKELAKQYGLGITQISRIVRGESW